MIVRRGHRRGKAKYSRTFLAESAASIPAAPFPAKALHPFAGALIKSALGVETQEVRADRSTNKTSAEIFLCGGLVCPGQTQTVSLIHHIMRMFFHVKLCLVLPPKRFCPFIRCRQKRLYIAFHIKVMPEGKIVIVFKGGGEVEEVL